MNSSMLTTFTLPGITLLVMAALRAFPKERAEGDGRWALALGFFGLYLAMLGAPDGSLVLAIVRVAAAATAGLALLWANADYPTITLADWPGYYRIEAQRTNTFAVSAPVTFARWVLGGGMVLQSAFACLAVVGLAPAWNRTALGRLDLGGSSSLSPLAALIFILVVETLYSLVEARRITSDGNGEMNPREYRWLSMAGVLLALPFFIQLFRMERRGSAPIEAMDAFTGPTLLAGILCLHFFAGRKQKEARRISRTLETLGCDADLSIRECWALSRLNRRRLSILANNTHGTWRWEARLAAFALLPDWSGIDGSIPDFLERFANLEFLLARHGSEQGGVRKAIRDRIEHLLIERTVPTLRNDAERLAFAEQYPGFPRAICAAMAELKDSERLAAFLESSLQCARETARAFLRSHEACEAVFRHLSLADALDLYHEDLHPANRDLMEARFAAMGIEASIVTTEHDRESRFDPDSSSYDWAAYDIPDPGTNLVHEKVFKDRLAGSDWTEAMVEERLRAQGLDGKDWQGLTLRDRAEHAENTRLLELLGLLTKNAATPGPRRILWCASALRSEEPITK